ncbi:MAG: electron transfer flavoprotein subunit beta/FixA family protein [Anaerolineae bacterium]
MKVIVLIKQIFDPATVRVSRSRGTLDLRRAQLIINPNDRNALEEALRLKDELDAQVTVLTLGSAEAEDALREALALGADEAILLSGEELADVDAAGAVQVLGEAIKKVDGFDLVLAGDQAADSQAGELGPRLAEYLNLPQVTNVFELKAAEGKVIAKRGWGEVYHELETTLPAVVTVAESANEPRYPDGAAIINAYREKEVTLWTLWDVGLQPEDLTSVTEVRRTAAAPETERGQLISGDPGEAAKQLVQRLKSDSVGGGLASPLLNK